MLLVKDRQILGISSNVLIWFFSLLYGVLSATGPQVRKHYPSDAKLHTGYRNRNYYKLTEQMDGKADKLFYYCISLSFLVAVKYWVQTEYWFITKVQPGLEEIAKIRSCEILQKVIDSTAFQSKCMLNLHLQTYISPDFCLGYRERILHLTLFRSFVFLL